MRTKYPLYAFNFRKTEQLLDAFPNKWADLIRASQGMVWGPDNRIIFSTNEITVQLCFKILLRIRERFEQKYSAKKIFGFFQKTLLGRKNCSWRVICSCGNCYMGDKLKNLTVKRVKTREVKL